MKLRKIVELPKIILVCVCPLSRYVTMKKSGAYTFKNDRVISILVLLCLAWFGMVWRFHEGAMMLP